MCMMKTASRDFWGDNLGMYSLKAVHVTLFAIRFRGHGGLQWNKMGWCGMVLSDTLWVLDLVNFNDSINRRLALQCANAACKVGLDERGSKLSFQREASTFAANIPTFQTTSTVERISSMRTSIQKHSKARCSGSTWDSFEAHKWDELCNA